MRIAVFLACIALAFARQPWERVSGGKLSPVGSRPYMAAILFTEVPMNQFCGGALIHPQWVVTSALCFAFTAGNVFVGLGFYDLGYDDSSDGAVMIHGTWHPHPGYGNKGYANDIALIKLDSPVTISDRIKTINMPVDGSTPSPGTSLLISGWGSIKVGVGMPPEMSQAVIKVSSLSVCTNNYGSYADETMICSDSTDQDYCQGDDGGPAVSNYKENSSDGGEVIEGLASQGIGCLDSNMPSLYTRISAHCSWIDAVTGHDVQCN